LDEPADVCCIAVPGSHCFSLANGAVVHNSHSADALRTMCASIRTVDKPKDRPRAPQARNTAYTPFG
jgi:hypothetical protein